LGYNLHKGIASEGIEMDLSRKIVVLRGRKGWSQIDLARASGIPQPTICRLERGAIRQPKMSTLVSIARSLGVSSDYLASDEYHDVKNRPPAVTARPRLTIEE